MPWSKTTVFKQTKFYFEEMSGAPVHNTTIARIVSPASSETLGGGIVIFEKCSYEWTVTYDEIFYIIDGQLRVVVDGENFDCETGDVIWLPRDTPLRYETAGKAVLVFTQSTRETGFAGISLASPHFHRELQHRKRRAFLARSAIPTTGMSHGIGVARDSNNRQITAAPF